MDLGEKMNYFSLLITYLNIFPKNQKYSVQTNLHRVLGFAT